GTTKADDRCELLKNFNDDNNHCFIFLLSTRAGGVGLNLQKADTVILFDSDWNPHQDQQAQDRAHRIGQKNEVRVLRLITVNTIEEKILACARYKLNVDEMVIQAGMFNRSSTSSERYDYLEQLIEGEDESKDDDEDIPDDEILNQMIARTESEFNLFNQIDMARREYESLHGVGSDGDAVNEHIAWRSTNRTAAPEVSYAIENPSNTMNKPKTSTTFTGSNDDDAIDEGEQLIAGEETTSLPLEELDDVEDMDFTQETSRIHRKMKTNRLITEDELPAWLKNDVDEVGKTLQSDEDFGKGRRQRKDIDYSDNLTEREFLQALEEGNLEDAIEQKRIRKQTRKSGNSLQDDDEIDMDETDACSSFETSSTTIPNQQHNIPSKRGSIKKRLEANDPKIAEQCRLLLENLLAYRTDDDRQLAQIFIRLPGQKQLPIYYQIIKDPIDFQRIRRKIDTYRYSNLEQFDADMKLLVTNAQTFNCETSVIYSDSIQLEKVYQNLREQLKADLLQLPTDTTKESTARSTSKRGRPSRATVDTGNKECSKKRRKRKAVMVIEDDDGSENEYAVPNNGDTIKN
ncbi:unnamed protein product, partial [Adineta ricciae]